MRRYLLLVDAGHPWPPSGSPRHWRLLAIPAKPCGFGFGRVATDLLWSRSTFPAGTAMPQFDLVVNRSAVTVTADGETPLLDVLRNHLGLDGTKFGCGLEQCGCCMVLIDGRPEKSCGKPLSTIAGREVVTIEGLGTPERPHPLQQAFLDEQAGQCGYCLAGILISAKALLDDNPAPSRSEIAAGARRQHLPLRQPSAHPARGRARRRWRCAPERRDERRRRGSAAAARSTTRASTSGSDLPRPAGSRSSTGRVEIGQGVLTAMRQIAAEELDVAPGTHRAADRRHRPDAERGLHRRQPVDPVRRRRAAPRLRRSARRCSSTMPRRASAMPRADLAVRDGAITRGGAPTGQDYWSLAGAIDLVAPRHRPRRRSRPRASIGVVGGNAPRVDLAAKVFGEPIFVHDMALDGMAHARVVRQPRRGADDRGDRRGCDPPGGKGPDRASFATATFLAIVGADETVVEAVAAMAPGSRELGRGRCRSTHRRRRRAGCCSSPRSTS